MRYIFADLETTGLDHFADQITEAAFISSEGEQFHGFIKHDRLPSDYVLDQTDYVQRILGAGKVRVESMLLRLRNMCERDGDTYLVGANPAFDHGFLEREYHNRNWNVPYHYHLIDVEALVMGRLGLPFPPKLKECRGLLGIPGENPAPHTALADAQEAQIIFEALQARAKSEAA